MSAPVQPSIVDFKQWFCPLSRNSVEDFVERHKLISSQKLQELQKKGVHERRAILTEVAFAFLQTECKQAAF